MTLVDELKAILTAELPDLDDADKLAAILYNRCYTASILEPTLSTATFSGADDLTPLLAAANQGRPAWDEGWRIDQLLDGGRIVARKGGAARAFLPGEYLTYCGIGSGPAAGAVVTVFIPSGSAELQPGYYHAFSEAVGELEENEQVVRFFWNVSAEGAPRLMETITREWNRFQIPFRFKCVNRVSQYPRLDAGVLYLHRRYYPICALLLESIYSRVSAWLYPGTPLFAKRLAKGLAFAEDPGESFGENRSKILAAAMVASRGKSVEAKLEEVAQQFQQRGLSLDQPWLNQGSIDRYEFPYPVS